jgi:hypothetical protein
METNEPGSRPQAGPTTEPRPESRDGCARGRPRPQRRVPCPLNQKDRIGLGQDSILNCHDPITIPPEASKYPRFASAGGEAPATHSELVFKHSLVGADLKGSVKDMVAASKGQCWYLPCLKTYAGLTRSRPIRPEMFPDYTLAQYVAPNTKARNLQANRASSERLRQVKPRKIIDNLKIHGGTTREKQQGQQHDEGTTDIAVCSPLAKKVLE